MISPQLFSTMRAAVTIAIIICGVQTARGEPASTSSDAKSPAKMSRRTPLVELVQRVGPSAVSIINLGPLPSGGSGFILHESGYIITNHHVAQVGQGNVVSLHDGAKYRYRVIAKSHREDLALIKIDAQGPLQPVRLGHSNDLMLGEDVLAIGNPIGLNHSLARGVVTGLDRDWGLRPNCRTIQIDAPIHGGNSGGPLFNALGELIGIIAQKAAENIGFAIRVDRMREVFPEMMSAEQRFGLVLGFEVDTMGQPAKVARVAPDSPAQKAGVRVGDEILRAGESSVHHGLDFYVSLNECKVGQPFPLKLRRSGRDVSTTLTPEAFKPLEPVGREGLRGGLRFSVYRGDWEKLPDFDKIEPVGGGVCDEFTLDVYDPYRTALENGEDNFGLKFEGFVEAPREGLYFFYTESDDGSRLYIGDRLVVDNDGGHGPRERSGQIRLNAGIYPITVTYFEAGAGEKLEVSVERLDIRQQSIPSQALFYEPENAEPAAGSADDSPE